MNFPAPTELLKLADEFEKLRAAYKSHWLVSDCKAFEKFCFLNSDQISAVLRQAVSVERADGWKDDPSADERWNAGLDYGMVQLCAVLGVDSKVVYWDAATETLDGDVCAAIGNIFNTKYGKDFDPTAPVVERAEAEFKIARSPMEAMLGRPYGQEKADVVCASAPCGWPICNCGRAG